jgi:hypothetical protein
MRNGIVPVVLFLGAAVLAYFIFLGGLANMGVSQRNYAVALHSAADLGMWGRSKAEAFRHDMRRWPDSLDDVEFDLQWVKAHPGIAEFRYAPGGAVYVALSTDPGKPAPRILWTPKDAAGTYTDSIDWDCVADFAAVSKFVPACRIVDADALKTPPAIEAADPTDENPKIPTVPGMNARCQVIGRAAYAAALARGQDDTLETFQQSNFYTSQYGSPNYDEMTKTVQWVYDSPRRSPGASQHQALRSHLCRSAN